MAAHGLTILRQIKNVCLSRPMMATVAYLDSALNAPGTCCTVGFDTHTWFELWSAQLKLADGQMGAAEFLTLLDTAIQKHMWMDAYPCMDAIKAAQALYVKPHTPHYRKRQDKFDAGDQTVHSVLRSQIAQSPQYGNRRAPTICAG